MGRLRGHRLATLAATAAMAATAVVVSTSSGQDAAPTAAAEIQSQRCFGAASRDPERRCVNKALRYAVVPTPAEAKAAQNYPCTPMERADELYACVFGARREEAVKTIALIGDSHAGHWRAALDHVAEQRRWHAISLTQTGCPLTRATPILRGRLREDCLQWNRELVPWLARHSEISTVFVSQHGAKVAVPPGETQESTQIKGFRDAFRALPPSVEQIVVIRDTPWSTHTAPACIERAVAERRRPDLACAIPRRRSLRPDLQAVAARRMKSPRVRLVNLTPFFCDRRHCFPVVGGALVHKDGGHITQVFSRTLGPYLGRAVDRLGTPGA
jgi:hypothetical protein